MSQKKKWKYTIRYHKMLQYERSCVGPSFYYLSDADFCLHILESLLKDGDEGPRGNYSPIDAGLVDVALQAKGEGTVLEA